MNQVQEIELSIANAQKMVDMGASLERLRNNKDFKKVIQEGYFEKEAIRLVHLKADPSMQTPDRQASILRDMDAVGALNQYFGAVFHQARLAAKGIEDDEQSLVDLRNEEVGGE
jgi:hypothetical protein